MILKDIIKNLPQSPGIYMMKDKDDNIIYVGKSIRLKDRVRSYFLESANHSRKIQRMVKNVKNIEIKTTDTELDALILECNMIQNIKPMYNTIMKKYENYKYIKINQSKEFPRIEIIDEIDDESTYFGPYTMDKKLEEIKSIFIDIYKLPSCKKQTKCINYDLNKCVAPCRSKISKEQYKIMIDEIIDTFKGNNKTIFDILDKEISESVITLNFEKAQEIQNKKNLIMSIIRKQNIINKAKKEELILAWMDVYESKSKLYLVKGGELINSKLMDKKEILNEDMNKIGYKMYDESKNKDSLKNKINKNNIDTINIIQSYIKNNESVKYIVL